MASYNLFQAPTIFLIETFYEQLWGFRPNLIPSFVKQKGALRSLFWFIKNTLKYESTLEQWGHMPTHVAATTLSVINNCPYSVFGHGFALGLAYLKQTGNLFPITEQELVELCGLEETTIVARLSQALEQAGLEHEIMRIQRLAELQRNPKLAATKRDRTLLHLIQMFHTLNACATRANIRRDQAHDALNKDRGLRDRYITLRRSQAAQATIESQTTTEQDTTVLNPADIAIPTRITPTGVIPTRAEW